MPDTPPAFYSASRRVLEIEFKALLDEYLAESPADISVRSLSDLVAFNERNSALEQAIFGQDILESSLAAPTMDSVTYQEALALIRKTTRDNGIDALLRDRRSCLDGAQWPRIAES